MALRFSCDNCHGVIIVKFVKVGEIARCPHCGASNTVPAQAAETTEEPDYIERAALAPPAGTDKRKDEFWLDIKPADLGPIGIGEILSRTFKLCWRNLLRFTAILAAPMVITALTMPPLFRWVVSLADLEPEAFMEEVGIAMYLAFSGLSLVYAFSYLGLMHAVSQAQAYGRVDIGACYRAAIRKYGWLVLAALVAYAIYLVVALPQIILGNRSPYDVISAAYPLVALATAIASIYLFVSFLIVPQVMLFEKVGPVGAFLRSWKLIKGGWWRAFALYLVASLILIIPVILLCFIPVVGVALAGLLVTAFCATWTTVLYFDVRARKDGLTTASTRI